MLALLGTAVGPCRWIRYGLGIFNFTPLPRQNLLDLGSREKNILGILGKGR